MTIVWKCPDCLSEIETDISALMPKAESLTCPECKQPVRVAASYFRHRTPNCNGVFQIRLPKADYTIHNLECLCCGRQVGRSLERYNPVETLAGDDITPDSGSREVTSVSVIDLSRGCIATVARGERVTLGRGNAAGVRLYTVDNRVSRVHLAVDFTGPEPQMEVLGINGVRVIAGAAASHLKPSTKAVLAQGITISIYDLKIVLQPNP